jgi:UDP-N-acetylglucosamine 4,6-dehydratase
MESFLNKRVLIVGATGSWGYCLTEKLFNLGVREIIGVSRNEYKQVEMRRKIISPRLKLVLGDIRDYKAMQKISKGVDIIFVLGAYKHVPLGEEQPQEFIKTNISGVENIIEAALSNTVDKVIYASTDKACSPNTLYGATKLIGEKLMANANQYKSTKFITVRAGNVLGSNGSVVPLFIDQIKVGKGITITDFRMTRYFLTLPKVINLLLEAVRIPFRTNVIVTKMPSCSILNLAEVLKEMYTTKVQIKEIGLRFGEKLHEMLLNEQECLNTYAYRENYYVISSTELDIPKVKFFKYASNSQPLMDFEQIKNLLVEGGFGVC